MLIKLLHASALSLLAAGDGVAESLMPSTREEFLWVAAPFLASVLILLFVERWVRALRKSIKKHREARERPGSSPLHPLQVSSFEEVLHCTARRCSCGAMPKLVYEGSTTSRQRKLRLMIEICPRCDNRLKTYYDVTEVADARPISPPPATPAPR